MPRDFLTNLLLGALSEGQARRQQSREFALEVEKYNATKPFQDLDELLKVSNIQSLIESRESKGKAKPVPTSLTKMVEDIDSQLISMGSGGLHPLNNLLGITIPVLLKRRENILQQLKGQGFDTTGLETPPIGERPLQDDELVPVINPEGRPVRIRKSMLSDALSKRYRLR